METPALNNEANTDAQRRVEQIVSQPTKVCDCCEEEWEEEFFCKECSGMQHFDGETEMVRRA